MKHIIEVAYDKQKNIPADHVMVRSPWASSTKVCHKFAQGYQVDHSVSTAPASTEGTMTRVTFKVIVPRSNEFKYSLYNKLLRVSQTKIGCPNSKLVN